MPTGPVPEEPAHGEPAPRGIQGRDPEQGTALHPWAREMYRQGLSFNGNERNKVFIGEPGSGLTDLSDVLGADSPLDGRALAAAW